VTPFPDHEQVKNSPGHAALVVLSGLNGLRVRGFVQQLLATTDVVTFSSTLQLGPAAANKGLALFPRRIGGCFYAMSRFDGATNAVTRGCRRRAARRRSRRRDRANIEQAGAAQGLDGAVGGVLGDAELVGERLHGDVGDQSASGQYGPLVQGFEGAPGEWSETAAQFWSRRAEHDDHVVGGSGGGHGDCSGGRRGPEGEFGEAGQGGHGDPLLTPAPDESEAGLPTAA
jgi:hypothetical protein